MQQPDHPVSAQDGTPLAHGGPYAPAVLKCGQMRADPASVVELSRANSYRLFGVLDGTAVLHTRDGAQSYGPEEVALVAPGTAQRLELSFHSRVAFVTFDVTPAPRVLRGRSWEHVGTPRRQPSPKEVWGVDLPQRIPRALCGRAIRALNLIRVDHWRSAAHYARSCAHLGTILGDLAVDAVTDWEPRGPGLPRTSSPWMIRVLELVEQHLSSSTAVQRIAELLGVTREHLTRSVKAETGLSLRQILDNRRKVVASEMLCDSSRSLQQIGQAVGYSHVSSFVHAFRRWLGVTPQQYRQRRRQ